MSEDNTLPKFVLRGPQKASLTIYQHGGHVTSWTSTSGEELLFLSKEAVFKPPKAIRGGIPVCFPQFGTLGPLSQHGFVRNSCFTVVSTTNDTAILSFDPTHDDLKKSPYPFRLTLTVQVGDNCLHQKMEVGNTGSAPFTFTAALHTYFRVASIDQVAVRGLEGVEYFDNVDGVDGKREKAGHVSVDSETDRIYKIAPHTVTVFFKQNCEIEDGGNARKFTLRKQGFHDVVLWNPWSEKAKGMSDFGDQEFKEMVCLEPAVAKSSPVTLAAGAQWRASQELTVSKL